MTRTTSKPTTPRSSAVRAPARHRSKHEARADHRPATAATGRQPGRVDRGDGLAGAQYPGRTDGLAKAKSAG
jgi:hypothetical protein